MVTPETYDKRWKWLRQSKRLSRFFGTDKATTCLLVRRILRITGTAVLTLRTFRGLLTSTGDSSDVELPPAMVE